MESENTSINRRVPWNKGKIVGQKAPFKSKEIWAIPVRLQMDERTRELALFNLGIDSKLRACDLTALQVRDICHGDRIAARACVLQRKTHRPVQFETSPAAREALEAWIRKARLQATDYLFPSRTYKSWHIGTRQYARSLTGSNPGAAPFSYSFLARQTALLGQRLRNSSVALIAAGTRARSKT